MTQTTATESKKFVVFQLADNEYVVPVTQVQGIEKMMDITRVPNTPSHVMGVVNLRGVVTPIIDLKILLGLEKSEITEATRIIIISSEEMNVGLIVDAANDVLDIPNEAIEPQPEVVGGVEQAFIAGVTKIEKRLLIHLHLPTILHVNGKGE